MFRRSTRVASGVLVATLCAGAPRSAEATPPPARPQPARIDARDVRPSALPDTRTGARLALVSQAPLTGEITSLAFSGDGRLLVAADRNGSVALVDAATGEVRSARTLVAQRSHSVNVQIDWEGRRALIVLLSADPNYPHEIFGWDLVTDDLTRLFTSRSSSLRPETIALAASNGEMLYVEAGPNSVGPHADSTVVRADARMRSIRRPGGEARHLDAVGFTPGLGLPYVFETDAGPPVRIYAGSGDVRVQARPADGTQLRNVIAFRPTGGQVAVVESTGTVALCSPIDGQCSTHVSWEGHVPTHLSYGLGGDCVLVGDGRGAHAFVDARSGTIVATSDASRRVDLVRGACTEALIPGDGGRLERVAIQRGGTTLGRADAPAVAGVAPIDVTSPVTLTASSATGNRLAFAVGRTLVIHDIEPAASRALAIVGVPGVVSDVVWSPSGSELFVRRDGEVLRASHDALQVIACEGDGAGAVLPDGSLRFQGALGCSIPSAHAPTDLRGSDLLTINATGTVAIGHSSQGFTRIGADAATVIWPAAEIPVCTEAACTPSALLARDGAFVALRLGGIVRVIEVASGRVVATLDGREASEFAFTADHQAFLATNAAGGFDSVDLRTGQSRRAVAAGRVQFAGEAEVTAYVVLQSAERPFAIQDARTNRAVRVVSTDAAFDSTGTLTLLRAGLYSVASSHGNYVLDVNGRRALRVDGTPIDAVHAGGGVTAAVCRDETMSVLSMVGAAAPRRVGQAGGCSRIRHAALRDDGSAVAIAAGDAAIVVQTPGDQPLLLLRAQLDLDGRSHPVAWVFGRNFALDDAVADRVRIRRPGPIATAVLSPVADDTLRAPSVQAPYFAAAH